MDGLLRDAEVIRKLLQALTLYEVADKQRTLFISVEFGDQLFDKNLIHDGGASLRLLVRDVAPSEFQILERTALLIRVAIPVNELVMGYSPKRGLQLRLAAVLRKPLREAGD